jgi:tight adherence protein B
MGMLPYLIAGLAALAVLVLATGIAMSGGSGGVAARLERYARSQAPDEPVDQAGNDSMVIAGLSRVIEGQDLATRLSTEIARADLKLRPAEFLFAWIMSPFLFAFIAYVIGFVVPSLHTIPALVLVFVIGAYFPRWYIGYRQRKRLAAFSEQLPNTITLLANSLRAGSSFLQGVELVTREGQPPISEEFERVVREMSLGVALQPALANLVRRVKSEDLELMVTAINIQSQVGGNLATVLDSIAFTIRERIRIIGEIRVLTSMQRYSGYVITLLPVGLAGILFLISPSYITALFRNPPQTFGLPTGVIFLIVGLISMGIGYVFIRRIVDIKV